MGEPLSCMQKYMVKLVGSATDISKQPPLVAARSAAPVTLLKSMKQSVDARLPEPGVAKLQEVDVLELMGEPLFVVEVLATGLATNVYGKLLEGSFTAKLMVLTF